MEEVIIGSQIWMAENLNVSTFRNGDAIPQTKTVEEWKHAGENKQPAWCYFDNNPKYGPKFGKLYNWYAVNDPRCLAPVGWHVPCDLEWTQLTNFLGGFEIAGYKMKKPGEWPETKTGLIAVCPSCSYWTFLQRALKPCEECRNTRRVIITRNCGFSGLAGGLRYYFGGFIDVGYIGDWWSSTAENGTRYAYDRGLIHGLDSLTRDARAKGEGLSVRCLRD
jgi:uncharacterized protein (TIGR02145 family)